MATKIETDLTPEELMEFFRRIAQTKGGATIARIQAIASEFGVTISHQTANEYRKGIVADYLDSLKRNAEQAELITAVAKGGLGLTDAAAVKLAVKINDDLDRSADLTADEKNSYSLAISRLRSGDQRSRFLEAKLREMVQSMELKQFDAAQAAIKHAKEIRAVMSDRKIAESEKIDRVRKILFGEQPKDFKPVTATGASVDETKGAK